VIEKIGIESSLRADGKLKRGFPCVWIWRHEVGRKGGNGAFRGRVEETTVEGVSVDAVTIEGLYGLEYETVGADERLRSGMPPFA